MSRWYRAYEGTVTDAKIGEAALVAGCSRSVAIAAWHCILESCASAQRGGEYETTPRRVAVILGEPVALIASLFDAFSDLGMISNGGVTAWKQRQYESDTSTGRSRKHRERRRNGDATLPEQEATAPETETETEAEREKDARAQGDPEAKVDPPHWQAVQSILETKSGDVDEWELDFLHSIKWKPSLTKPQANSLKAIQGKLASAGVSEAVPKQVVVIEGTAAWKAWEKYRGKRPPTTDIRIPGKQIQKGWYFPSEYPPSAENEAAA